MEFQKYVPGLALNGLSVASYSDGTKIRLVVENEGEAVPGFRVLVFSGEAEYDLWIDTIADEEDWFYNKALCLSNLLDYMRDRIA